jgi:hypothetical protein
LAHFHFHRDYCWKGISDLLLIVFSGMCREALRLLKESHTDKKNGIEEKYREAHMFL